MRSRLGNPCVHAPVTHRAAAHAPLREAFALPEAGWETMAAAIAAGSVAAELRMEDAGCQACGAGLSQLREYFRRIKVCEVGRQVTVRRSLTAPHVYGFMYIGLNSVAADLPQGRHHCVR